jgi:prepilin-type N-terminal cleavage/methylation domain-containing protein
MRSPRGFTLIELLLVVTITGILVGAATVTFDDDQAALEAAASQLAADLATAQSLAMECRLPVGLAGDIATGRTSFVLADGTTPRAAEASLRGLGSLSATELDRLVNARSHGELGYSPVRLSVVNFAGADRVLFDAAGTPAASGLFELAIGSHWLRVRCAHPSGRITTTSP